VDLSDGRMLIRLLEIISGDKIGHVGRGRLRINKIENVGRAISFLQQKKVCCVHASECGCVHMCMCVSECVYVCVSKHVCVWYE